MTNLFLPNVRTLLASLPLCAAFGAHAGDYSGQIAYHNDILQHSFTITERANFVAWTDSYLGGINFDPIVAVWHDGQLLGEVDDDPSIAPGQTIYDSGLRLYDLAPGTYLFTIAAYDNFANGPTLSSGFRYDGQTPIPLAEWCQPANACNMGPDVSLHWTLNPVPEPSAWALLLAGMALVGARAARRGCLG